MADTIGNLLKEDDGKSIGPADSQKNLIESKRRMRVICLSLSTDTVLYDPVDTVSSIQTYISKPSKIDRLLYSEISGYIAGLDEKSRGVFTTNIEKLLQYVLEDSNSVTDDTRKICIKLYDHFQLNIIQIERANTITKEGISKAMENEVENLHSEIKGIQKEYITILGILAAIMLAFVGAFTFSTSVLNNLGNVGIWELIIVALVVGLVFTLLISILIDFLREINSIVDKGKEAKQKFPFNNYVKLLAFFLAIALFIFGICQLVLLQQNNARAHQQQIVETSSSSVAIEEVTADSD